MAQEICDGRHSGPGQLANVSSISNWNSSSQRDPRNLDQEDDENGGARKKQRREDNSFLGMEREELISAENRAGREASGLTGAITRISRGNEGPSLEGGLSREGDSWYGALALPSVSRGVIETEVSSSVRGNEKTSPVLCLLNLSLLCFNCFLRSVERN